MKSIFTVAVMSLILSKRVLASEAFFPAKVIAELTASGGFVPNPELKSGIRIQVDGSVLEFRDGKTTVLAKLSPAKISSLLKEVNKTQPAKLELENPEGPECADIPTVSYTIRKKTGETVEIAREENCKAAYLANGEGRLIVEILKGLNKLTFLD